MLEELLGVRRVADLSTEEIVYLASLAQEDLPGVSDDFAALLDRRERQQFAQAQALLAMRQPRVERQARTMGSGRPDVRHPGAERITQRSFFDDEMLPIACLEALLS